MTKKLTPNQEIFKNEWLIDRNGTRAYQKAYPSVKKDETARVNASRLLTKANIKLAIQEALKAQEKRTQITADQTLKEIARVAFFDPRKLFDKKGKLKRIIDMDDDTAACIGGIDVIEQVQGQGEDAVLQQLKKFKIWDKNSALKKLAKHFKLLTEKHEHTGKDGGPIKTGTQLSPESQELLQEILKNAKKQP